VIGASLEVGDWGLEIPEVASGSFANNSGVLRRQLERPLEIPVRSH
jgi:hypothetical protein